MTTPSVSKLAGQLTYLFDEDPSLRDGPVEQLRARLNHDDRYARAIAKYPLESDAEITHRVEEFDERISAADIEAARQLARDR